MIMLENNQNNQTTFSHGATAISNGTRQSAQCVKDPVVIVGGGIAGLALARALQGNGIPYQLVERRTENADSGLAFNLPGNAIAALSMLGLREQIEAVGRPIGKRQYRTASDKLLFEIDEDTFWGTALRPRSVRRSDLLSMLETGLPDSLIHHDASVQSIVLQSNRPEVRMQNGTTLGASLVVGADGVRSTVRRDMFGSVTGESQALLAQASWRFMAPNPGIDGWTVWAGADGMVLLMPVGDDEVYGWAAATSPKITDSSPRAFVSIANHFPTRVRKAILYATDHPEGLYHSPLEEVRLERWHREHAVLIGDAAHATAPVWAEGVALGLEDAIVLGRLLAGDSDIATALREFETLRRARVTHVQTQTDAMSRAARLPALLRNFILPFVGPKKYRQTYGPLRDPV